MFSSAELKEKSTVNTLKVGVVGYCPPTKFDEIEARRMILAAYNRIATENVGSRVKVVSGLTNIGVLKIAYEEAANRGWSTVGIACEKASEHPQFPVDEKIIVGQNWGDESPHFLEAIDMIVRIGGGKQSLAEVEQTRASGKQVIEYDLVPLTD